jgi:hypothetical protein
MTNTNFVSRTRGNSAATTGLKGPTLMNALTQTPLTDAWDAPRPNASPVRGREIKLDGSRFVGGREKSPIDSSAQYLVTGKAEAWQKLERGTPPAYVGRAPGQPKPEQPFVPEDEWPKNLSGVPTHPWSWTTYLYLLNTSTGVTSTFTTSSAGGGQGIDALDEQIASMRQLQPGALPVIKLVVAPFPTRFGMKTRPDFEIVGWRNRGGEQPVALLEHDPDDPAGIPADGDEPPFFDDDPAGA